MIHKVGSKDVDMEGLDKYQPKELGKKLKGLDYNTGNQKATSSTVISFMEQDGWTAKQMGIIIKMHGKKSRDVDHQAWSCRTSSNPVADSINKQKGGIVYMARKS